VQQGDGSGKPEAVPSSVGKIVVARTDVSEERVADAVRRLLIVSILEDGGDMLNEGKRSLGRQMHEWEELE
jgi:hypothetical protein